MIRARGCPIEALDLTTRIDRNGFVVVGDVLDEGTIRGLLDALDCVERRGRISGRGQLYAIRGLMDVLPAVRELTADERIIRLIEPLLGPRAFAVQGIFFDKPAKANWKVPWHQDLSISVKARVEAPGFGPWSMKAGVPHVQAPSGLLERMLIVRLHLDESTAENGPLRVIAGSHLQGRLSREQIDGWRERGEEVLCAVPRGGALLMRPLLLHASSATRHPGHRRVVHLEYVAEKLPDGLEWAVDHV